MSESSAHESEPLPESEVVFEDMSIDGLFLISVWRDHSLLTQLMLDKNVAAMGMLRIYATHTGEVVHEERVPLSESTLIGPGPSGEEVDYWSSLIEKYTPEP